MLFSGAYEDIIQTLGSWRVLDLKTLLRRVDYNYSYQAFAKRVKKLEDFGYLGSIYFQSYRKYLYLTEKGLKEAGLERAWPINKDILHHDIIAVNVFSYFLGQVGIKNGNINLDRAGADKRPDCYLTLKPNTKNINTLAIEVELTQKSYTRIDDKFLDYLKGESYDLVLYLFQKAATFDAYKKTLEHIDSQRDPLKRKMCRDKIMLLLEPEIKHRTFNLMESVCAFEGKIEKFRDIFKRITVLRDES